MNEHERPFVPAPEVGVTLRSANRTPTFPAQSDAACWTWRGNPQLEIDIGEQKAHARFSHDSQLVFAITAGVSDSTSLSAKISTLTERDGVVRRTVAEFSGEGLSVRPGGALPEIGETHPLACTLRELGLPRCPLCTVSVRHASADFGVPHPY